MIVSQVPPLQSNVLNQAIHWMELHQYCHAIVMRGIQVVIPMDIHVMHVLLDDIVLLVD
jgi:hypothetical protein